MASENNDSGKGPKLTNAGPDSIVAQKTGPSMGMRMELRQTLGLSQTQSQATRTDMGIELEDPEKEAIQNAMDFWSEKPVEKMEISLSQLRSILSDPSKEPPKALPENPEEQAGEKEPFPESLSEEFIMLTPEEMATIDPDEKVGILKGDFIFVSKDTPEDYVPIVVLNLAILRRLGGDEKFVQFIRGLGVKNIDESRHWTANVVDIIAASKQFGEGSKEFGEFLNWRKQVERTDFFNDPTIGDFIRSKQRYHVYKRTTHPGKRWRYGKQSWNKSAMTEQLGRQFADEHSTSLLISHSDVISRRISEMPEYDPELMLRVLDQLGQNQTVDFTSSPELDNQAYLISEEVLGTYHYILGNRHGTSQYFVKSCSQRTIQALKDRISYFCREAVKKLDGDHIVNQKLIDVLKGPRLTLINGETSFQNVNLDTPDAQSKMDEQVVTIRENLNKIDQLIGEYDKLEGDLLKMANVGMMPTSIAQEKLSLANAKAKLVERLVSLGESAKILTSIQELRQKRQAILSNIHMEDAPRLKVV